MENGCDMKMATPDGGNSMSIKKLLNHNKLPSYICLYIRDGRMNIFACHVGLVVRDMTICGWFVGFVARDISILGCHLGAVDAHQREPSRED